MNIEHLEAKFKQLWGEASARRSAESNKDMKTESLSSEFVTAYNKTLEHEGLPLEEWRTF